MQKQRILLVLITLFILFAMQAARAQPSDAANAGVDWNNSESIQDTWHGVATTGLVFAVVVGGLMTALRVRSTHLRQQSGQGGPQQLGLAQLPVKAKADLR